MTISFIQHRVADYDTWRPVYDDVAQLQRDNGVIAEAVYRSESDPNDVLIMHQFSSSQEAHAFFELPELRAAMETSNVDTSSVRLEFYEQA
jgi:quinol monooxygenase YgiN